MLESSMTIVSCESIVWNLRGVLGPRYLIQNSNRSSCKMSWRRSRCVVALAGSLLLACIATNAHAYPMGEEWRRARPRHRGHMPAAPSSSYTNIGVNYGMVADNLPPPTEVAQLIGSTYISGVRLYTADGEALKAFANTGIKLIVGVADEDVPLLASSQRAAIEWAQANLTPYYPATNVVMVSVGNEILSSGKAASMANLLLFAMQNLHQALTALNMQSIKVSTTHSMAILGTSYPPSSSTFLPSLMPILTPLLSFLSTTDSPFMSNTYPYFAYSHNSKDISLDYALFQPNPGISDPSSGLHYSNLFDAQVDALFFALHASGFDHLQLVVAETGWPSAGDTDEIGAGLQNAQAYNSNLIKHIMSGAGTPYKPNAIIDTYIFAMFNEDLKPGPTSERNFGLFHPDKTAVYDVGLMKSSSQQPPTSSSTPANTTSSSTPEPNGPGTKPTSVWCVAKTTASVTSLQLSLAYACGEGGADCTAIEAGASCFNPNTLVSHASYAMNSYYQLHGRNYWNCYFNGAGVTTTTNPSYGSCIYSSQ